ncbi:MAG: hypothetical protein ACE5K8_02015 [Candidatus Zixiibacteriota bacterium]
MKLILLIASLLFLLAGLVLRFMVRRHRTESAPPMPSFNPVHWFQPWKITDWLTPKGIRLHMTSLALLLFGIVLYLLANGIPPLFD